MRGLSIHILSHFLDISSEVKGAWHYYRANWTSNWIFKAKFYLAHKRHDKNSINKVSRRGDMYVSIDDLLASVCVWGSVCHCRISLLCDFIHTDWQDWLGTSDTVCEKWLVMGYYCMRAVCLWDLHHHWREYKTEREKVAERGKYVRRKSKVVKKRVKEWLDDRESDKHFTFIKGRLQRK